ncbi:SMI1/KNR4 family protein [Chitinophaga lutea]|uniref:SMI1/KNR4 family protein n=1 Tax=Chitinophaga lutea TaxID=2488634 RepID=A0A3N4Q0U6_9BACT|nr:SMI1/KNR4 family protein [Chitinophaga lutea]RPE09570.1 SMI1/KNR4 family protein [Chitinophaga lutea]
MNLTAVVALIAAKHKISGIDLHPPALPGEIAAFEGTTGFKLPDDFAEFYAICNGFTCHEDIFNMKSLQDITESEGNYGNGRFFFADYMIDTDLWELRKAGTGGFEIVQNGQQEVVLTSSLLAFLERYLQGNVFDRGGLHDWRQEII